MLRRSSRARGLLTAAVMGVVLGPTAPTALAVWSGAATGTTNDATHTYTATGNWVGSSIDDSFSGFTLTGTTTLFFGADRATVAAGFNFGYAGNFNLTLQSDSATSRLITLNGNIGGDFGGTNDRTLAIGTSTAPLVLDLNGTTRTFLVTDSGDTLSIANAIQDTPGGAGISKTGTGRLTLNGASTFTGGVALSAGILRLGANTTVTSGSIVSGPVGTGTLAISAGTTLEDNGTNRTIANPVTIAGSMTFASSGTTGITFDGSALTTPATITLSGTPTLTVNNIVTSKNPILGTTFTKAGTGTMILDADNSSTITGVTVSAGLLRFDRASAIPGATGRTVTIATTGTASNGGTLTFDQSVLDRFDTASAGVAAIGANTSANLDFTAFSTLRLGSTGTFTYSGTLTPLGTVYRLGGGGGTLTVSSVLAGGNTLNVGNNGTTSGHVALTNVNNAFNSTTIDAGSLNIPIDGNAGDATSPLGPVPSTPTDNITVMNSGVLRFVTGSVLNPNRTIVLGTNGGGFDTNGNNVSVTNNFSGTNPLLKTGAGTLSLPGTSLTLPGLNVTGGTINLNATTTTFTGAVTVGANAPGTAIVPAGSSFVMNAATANFAVGNRTSVANNINDLFDASAASSVSITAATLQVGTTSGSPDHTGTGPTVTFTLPTGASSTGTINAGTSISVGLGENNGDGTSTFNLGGGTNTIRTPLISIGQAKTAGVFKFQAGSGGSVSIAETGGDGKTNLLVGNNTSSTTGTNPASTFTLATTGTVTAAFGTISIPSTTNNTGTGGGASGTFTLNATGAGSAVTADSVLFGVNTSGTSQLTTSNFNLVAGNFTFNSGGTGFTVGTGTVTVRNSAISVSGGTLDMNGKPINAVANGTGATSTLSITGGVVANASTIGNFTTLTFTGGTLRDAATISRAVTQTGASSLLDVTSASGTGTTISGAYALASGAASVAAGKTLSVAGDLTLDPTVGGTLGVSLSGASSGQYVTTGTGKLGLTSTTADKLLITPLTDITSETTYTIASFPGSYVTGDSDFEQVVLSGNLATQDTNPAGANYVLVTYKQTSIDITVNNVSAVPEPAAAGTLAAAAMGLLARRRRVRR